MDKPNFRIRLAAREAGIHHWEIAETLGISEGAFCRRMRHELLEAEQARILATIDEISRRREEKFHVNLH